GYVDADARPPYTQGKKPLYVAQPALPIVQPALPIGQPKAEKVQIPPGTKEPDVGPVRPVGPFGPGQFRLPLLDERPDYLGKMPQPSKETLARFNKYIEGTVDPANTLDLIQNRARLIILKDTPTRIQLSDESVAAYNLVSPKEITILGRSIGTTVFNM